MASSSTPLTPQIVDVRFQPVSSATKGEVSKSQETRLLNSTPYTGQPSLRWDDSITLSPPKSISLPREDDGDQSCRPSKLPSIRSVPEQQNAPCVPSVTPCKGSVKPKCRPFPYDEANPIDIIDGETAVEEVAATIVDDDVQMTDYPRSNSDGSTSIPSEPWSNEASASSATSTSPKSNKADSIDHESHDIGDGLTNLDSLNFLVNHNSTPAICPNAESADTLTKSRSKLCKDIRTALQSAQHSTSGANPNHNASALQDLNLSEGYRSHSIRLHYFFF